VGIFCKLVCFNEMFYKDKKSISVMSKLFNFCFVLKFITYIRIYFFSLNKDAR